MKMRSALIFLCLIFTAANEGHSTPALTAEELAQYLGVHDWESTVDVSGPFKFEILQIEDGKVSGKLVEGSSDPEVNPARTMLVIIGVGDAPGTVRASVTVGGYGVGGQEHGSLGDTKSGFASASLPDRIKPGDYVLGGGFRIENGHTVISRLTSDLKNGFLLRITPTGK